ncbi:MAG TPA: acetylornithine transaminase [Clostridiaceae bacterium]|nr:acetylornithine transaminase [Clostridiaceae bacterium]
MDLDRTYVVPSYRRYPLELVCGRGSEVTDRDGRVYIDLGSGLAVNTLGFSDPAWCEAVTAQLTTLQHSSNLYFTKPAAQLAEQLCLRSGMKKVFFSNSGAEANECAIKAARKYAELHYPGQRDLIVTLRNSFHGRTLATLAATGQSSFHQEFLPLTPGFESCEPSIEHVCNIVEKGQVAAFLIEIVQGEGGVVVLDPAFVRQLASLAAENDILLIADEVQTGAGRTGKLFAYMHTGITPDIVSTAKGLSGGLPLGATLFGEKTADVLGPGSHGSTFGGNPVAAAGALHVLSRLDDDLLHEVESKSAYIRDTLSSARGIIAVTGIGLMIGIKTVRPAALVIDACREAGVIVLQAKDRIRLLPALNIPWPLLKKAIRVVADAADETGKAASGV